MSQFTIFDESQSLTFSARAIKPTSLIVLTKQKIFEAGEKFEELKKGILEVKSRLEEQGFPLLDYQVQRKALQVSALLLDQKLEPGRLMVYTINKLIIFKRYMRKKAFRIQDLIAYLRRTEKENQD